MNYEQAAKLESILLELKALAKTMSLEDYSLIDVLISSRNLDKAISSYWLDKRKNRGV